MCFLCVRYVRQYLVDSINIPRFFFKKIRHLTSQHYPNATADPVGIRTLVTPAHASQAFYRSTKVTMTTNESSLAMECRVSSTQGTEDKIKFPKPVFFCVVFLYRLSTYPVVMYFRKKQQSQYFRYY